MKAAIIEMCGAVLGCDAATDATKAWARDLMRRCGALESIFS